MIEEIEHTTKTGTLPEHTTGTHDHWKREDSGKAGKSEYICIIAGNEKKLKKIWKCEKTAVPLQKKQQNKAI